MSTGESSGVTNNGQGSFTQDEARQIAVENESALKQALISDIQTDYYVGENGKALSARYKRWIGVSQRQKLLNRARNSMLKNAVDQLYRPGSFIGDGGTASIIKLEKRTGLKLGRNGGNHQQKAIGMIRYIERRILTQTLSASDRKLALKLVKKLKQALGE